MRLWQKVFVVTLVFMLIGTQLTAYLIAYRNYRDSIENERGRVISEHRLFVSGAENSVFYGLLDAGRLVLDEDFVNRTLKDISASEPARVRQVMIYENSSEALSGRTLLFAPQDASELEMMINNSSLPARKDVVSFVISDIPSGSYAAVSSRHRMGIREYDIYTFYDVSEIYESFDTQVKKIRTISIIVSLATATVLLVLVIKMLRPIDTIQKDIRLIADGNYSRRIEINGSPEFVEIADSINEMARAIEENVGDIQSIADSRKQFIDNLAHEMKTPLTSIMGFADILRIQRNIKEKQRIEYSAIILEEAKRLRSLSGKILQLATADKVELDISDTDVEELLREVYTSVLPLIVDHGMKLDVTCIKDTRLKVDREMIKSLLYNLIDNAVKASEEGSEIRLDCSEVKDSIVISVIDHGSGMKPEHIKRVTEPFYMVDKSRSRKAGGAGLGLALCLAIAKQHDARLKIESEVGKGTTVMVIFGGDRA